MKMPLKYISWRAIRVWQRNFDVYKATWKVNFLPPVLEPLLFLLAFGVGLGSMLHDVPYGGGSVSYLKFIAPGLIATTCMNHSFFETTYASFVRMYYQKTFDAILATPLMLEDVILGEIFWAATKATFAGTIMLTVSVLWGLVDPFAGVFIIPVIFLAGAAFASLGMCFTALVRQIEMFNFPVFLFITPMFLFSGVFFPLSTLPVWAQNFARILPLTWLVDIIRAIVFRNYGPVNNAELLILIVFVVIFTFLAISLMKKRIFK
jgi:lipooligosaccharide transport system permease protein